MIMATPPYQAYYDDPESKVVFEDGELYGVGPVGQSLLAGLNAFVVEKVFPKLGGATGYTGVAVATFKAALGNVATDAEVQTVEIAVNYDTDEYRVDDGEWSSLSSLQAVSENLGLALLVVAIVGVDAPVLAVIAVTGVLTFSYVAVEALVAEAAEYIVNLFVGRDPVDMRFYDASGKHTEGIMYYEELPFAEEKLAAGDLIRHSSNDLDGGEVRFIDEDGDERGNGYRIANAEEVYNLLNNSLQNKSLFDIRAAGNGDENNFENTQHNENDVLFTYAPESENFKVFVPVIINGIEEVITINNAYIDASDGTGQLILGEDGWFDGLFGDDVDLIIGDGTAAVLQAGDSNRSLLLGASEGDLLLGGEENDTLIGQAGHDVLHGGDGNDIHDGGAGDDLFLRSTGIDSFYGGAGNDTIDYSAHDSAVYIDLTTGVSYDNYDFAAGTGQLKDSLSNIESAVGTDYTDVIFGTTGDNTLEGGGSGDFLVGGPGDDSYVFGGNFGQDVLQDTDGTLFMKNAQGQLSMLGGVATDDNNDGIWELAHGSDTIYLQPASLDGDGLFNDAGLIFDGSNAIYLQNFELVEGNSLYNITLGDVEEEEEEEEFNGPETVTLTLTSEADGTDDGVFNPTPFTLTFTVDTLPYYSDSLPGVNSSASYSITEAELDFNGYIDFFDGELGRMTVIDSISPSVDDAIRIQPSKIVGVDGNGDPLEASLVLTYRLSGYAFDMLDGTGVPLNGDWIGNALSSNAANDNFTCVHGADAAPQRAAA
jgi:hypothetical protein